MIGLDRLIVPCVICHSFDILLVGEHVNFVTKIDDWFFFVLYFYYDFVDILDVI